MLVTDGGFRTDRSFVHLPLHDVAALTEAFRRAVLKMFVRRELMDMETAQSRNANADCFQQPPEIVEPESEAVRDAKRRWAELLRRILEVEPLRCPRCGETTMRIVSFITEPKTIDKILDHLRRTQLTRRRQRAPPRRWRSAASTASA